jgi:cysteinyl-tRNA synthetase
VADLLRRTLGHHQLQVKFVMNVTDVDDKTINKSQAEHKPLSEVTSFYTQKFLDDLHALNIIQPTELVKATQEIEEMVGLIKILLEKGFAYISKNGSIYFDISKLPAYGQIAQVDLTGLRDNAEGRLNTADEYEKDNARDFALWKAYDESDGDVYWDTDLGKGRPGWHIECSAMSSKYLGQPFDIHMGGIDLLFPHHTNEIAQSEAAHGTPLANYWVHTEHLLVDNTKMSKSKNNFYTAADLTAMQVDLMAFRYLIISAHYRSKLNFTWDSLFGAQNTLTNLRLKLAGIEKVGNILNTYHEQFMAAVDDDLNFPEALAVLWDMMDDTTASGPDKLATVFKFDDILGLQLKNYWDATHNIPKIIKDLVDRRNLARQNKDFAESDKLRAELEQAGYVVEDGASGTVIKKINI